MSPKLKELVTARELLEADENTVIVFLSQSHRRSRFDISCIVDFDTLSAAQREELSTNLM